MTSLTHSDLVEMAARWLRRKYPVVVTEIASWAREQPDAIGFRDRESCLVECKVSHSDFLADTKKRRRWTKLQRVGLGNLRYYFCRAELIKPDELPPGWGLLWVRNGRIRHQLTGARQDRNVDDELTILMSVIRRIGSMPITGVSIKAYQHNTGNRTTLHVRQLELDHKIMESENEPGKKETAR